jgi:hypothetical protein
MAAGQWFWILYVICIVFSGWAYWPFQANYRPFMGLLVLYVLVGLLGWHVFGPVLR